MSRGPEQDKDMTSQSLKRHTSIPLTESEIRILEDIQEDLRAHRKKAREDMKELSDRFASVNDGIAQLQAGVGSLEDDVGSMQDDVRSMRDGVGSLKESVASLKDVHEAIESNTALLRNMQGSLDRMEENVAQIRKDRDRAQLRIEAQKKTREAIERRLRSGVDKSVLDRVAQTMAEAHLRRRAAQAAKIQERGQLDSDGRCGGREKRGAPLGQE